MYYYKYNPESEFSIYELLLITCVIVDVTLDDGLNDVIRLNKKTSYYGVPDHIEQFFDRQYSNYKNVVGFSIIDVPVKSNIQGPCIEKGNLIDKLVYIGKLQNPSVSIEEINQMIEYLNSCVQEITKEEYESMLN